MALCPICRNSEANKKNVHLIPWFLIKSCITKGGTGERGKEFSFSIDSSRFTKIYTGQSILPEKIEEFGDWDELQKEKDNPYSRDNLICLECENKLARLEAIFASEFAYKKIVNSSQRNHEKFNEHSIMIKSNYDHSQYSLFIQSVFYRCSIGRFDGFSLRIKTESQIAQNLRRAFLLMNPRKISAVTPIDYRYHFPMITATMTISQPEDPTKKFIVMNNSRFPYLLITGHWLFQMYEEEKNFSKDVDKLYGLKEVLNPLKAHYATKEKAHVILLETNASQLITTNLLHFITDQKIKGLQRSIRIIYTHIFKQPPDQMTADCILQRYFAHKNDNQTEFYSLYNAFREITKKI